MESDQCRRCGDARETIEHIISGCKVLAGNEYIERHDTAAKIIHQELAKEHHLIQTTNPHYKYKPESILENEKHKLYWNRTMHTDKTVAHNRPDITLICKQEQTTYLIDIAIPGDTNVAAKEQEKVTKYIPLAVEMKEIWKQKKVIVIPVVISATGVTSKNFMRHIEKIKVPKYIHSIIQKAVILKTANTVRKFLQ
uniref:Reverse transcriptase zinc-binding domain-containing protein n=1 Tax=Cacopsylla melanoneura TaxID=428564 RepID=A0A8D8TN34_9HEMI